MAKAKSDPLASLGVHADGRDTLEFSERILHGKLAFAKGEVVRFADPRVAAYFDAAFNGTEFTDKEPTRTVTDEELNFDPDDPRENDTIDPDTVIGNGREGVVAGTTVHQHVTGQKGSGTAPLAIDDVVSSSR